ncbi:MAG: extracellular solute-binding protein [Clostridia bacterium]|nr:extracellular solute-binding protein [Clostridia bacterium]
MKRRKPIALILSVLMAFSVASFVGCKDNDDPFVEKLDPTRTQIYVYNYYAGFRADWLLSAKKQFEEMYKDYPGVDGKVGVQILMDNRKQEFNDAASTVRNGTNEVYFTEGTSFHGLYNGDGLYDMTEWMTEPLTEFGETRSIADKMTAEQREYMGVEIDGKERYFSLPNYSGFSGIVYNKDLFKSKGFYYKKGHESASSIYDKFTGDTTDLSSGPDGEYGTYDDGMPATYEEFYTLCNYIKGSGVVPFIWTGVHYKAYFGKLMMSLVADYEGPEETRLNFSPDGVSHTLINADGTSYQNSKEQGFVINESNAYELARQEGRLKATEFIKEILDTSEWQSSNAYEGVVSHTDAQALYLSSGMDGNRQIAMLIDGSWWEGEATDAFDDTAIRYNAGNKYERNFGFLPLPKADKTKKGQRTILDDLGSMVFVKATLAPEKEDIVGKFIRFMNSDKMLSEFTRITSALKALDYEVAEEDYAQMTTFAKDLWEMRKSSNMVYNVSDTPLVVNNRSYFAFNTYWYTRVNGRSYQYASEAIHANPSASVREIFQGMIDYQSSNWWNELSK